jgi:hypothetical protein
MEKSGRHREFWGLYGEIPRKKLNKVEARETLPTCGHAAQICPDHSMLLNESDSFEAPCCTRVPIGLLPTRWWTRGARRGHAPSRFPAQVRIRQAAHNHTQWRHPGLPREITLNEVDQEVSLNCLVYFTTFPVSCTYYPVWTRPAHQDIDSIQWHTPAADHS